ncbi:MAG: TRZ/ATZ family hydrolase [Neisseriaceae bacterium]|nr:MAG: TRZ/ATZ family hydrolase [Neisseriaceae bacterium]
MSKKRLIQAKWIVTMEDKNPILEDYGIVLNNNIIEAILSPKEIKKTNFEKKIELRNHILMPGFINLHGHSAMTLFRGYADDLVLMDWLNKHIWPLESKFVSEKFVYDGSLLAMAEMILSGTTTINDMYFFHSGVAKAGIEMGMRTFVGCSILEFPTNYAQNSKEYIKKSLEERAKFTGEPLITFTLAPHAPYTVTDETFKKIVKISEQEDMLIHCHIHETETEIQQSVEKYNERPFDRLQKLGILQANLIAAHMVFLSNDEIQRAQRIGLSISHNPSSNMKLSSGFAPISTLLEQGVNVGLGTDGAASNNRLDMFSEMRLASLIAKGYSKQPTDLSAYETLKMATINGARALHIDDKVGSICVGKHADIIAVDTSKVENQPVYDPISHLVYTLGRENISDVWINGRRVLKNRVLTNIAVKELHKKAKHWQKKLIT